MAETPDPLATMPTMERRWLYSISEAEADCSCRASQATMVEAALNRLMAQRQPYQRRRAAAALWVEARQAGASTPGTMEVAAAKVAVVAAAPKAAKAAQATAAAATLLTAPPSWHQLLHEAGSLERVQTRKYHAVRRCTSPLHRRASKSTTEKHWSATLEAHHLHGLAHESKPRSTVIMMQTHSSNRCPKTHPLQ